MTTHVFLPVYLDGNKQVIDNSTNAVETLDASFNFIMNTTFTQATNLSQFLKYKKSNNNYLFKFNESYKIICENQIRNDISGSYIELYDTSFNSGISPEQASIGRMLVRYIADTLMGHPFAQAFITNESEIISKVIESNLHKQITISLSNNLSTSSFTNDNVCLSLLNQFLENSPERFSNDVDDTEYNFPFQSGDYITLFIKMNSSITLDNRSTMTTKSSYDILKSLFQGNINVTFNDTDSTLKINEKIWRIKIQLL